MSTTQASLASWTASPAAPRNDATSAIPDSVAAWFEHYDSDHQCPKCAVQVPPSQLPRHYREECPCWDWDGYED